MAPGRFVWFYIFSHAKQNQKLHYQYMMCRAMEVKVSKMNGKNVSWPAEFGVVVVGGCVGIPVGIGWSSMQVSVLQREELLQMQ